MSNSENFIQVKKTPISEITTDTAIANLGVLLEITERLDCYELIIFRMNQKQVMKFEKTAVLLTEDA